MSADIPEPFVDEFRRSAIQTIERAALVATHKAARGALGQIRAEMKSRELAGLSNALGSFSDFDKGRVYRQGAEAFSASAGIYLRSKSERTVGAIISYTEGATITPTNSRWLWFPTEEIQRFVGSKSTRRRLTPGLWKQRGLDAKIGPLIPIRGINGYPLLILKNVGVSLAGKKRSVKGLKKNGQPRKGQVAKEFIVAFIGIPNTRRARRVDLIAIAQRWASLVPDYFAEEMQKGR